MCAMLLRIQSEDQAELKGFRLPLAAELLSLCVAKEKVTKEKGHPAWRLPGILPGKSVSRGRAFRTGILPVRKGVDIPVDSRYAACRPRLTAAQGTPGRAAGHRGPHSVIKRKSRSHSTASLCCGFAPALDLALLKSVRWERAALPGAPMARRVGGGKPAGWPAGMPASLSSGQDALSKSPAPAHGLVGQEAQQAPSGVAFLFG